MILASDTKNGNGVKDAVECEHEEVEETLARHEQELEDLRRKVRAIDLELRTFRVQRGSPDK